MFGISHHHCIVGGEFPLLQDFLQRFPGRCIRRCLKSFNRRCGDATETGLPLPQLTPLKGSKLVCCQGKGNTGQQVQWAVRNPHDLRIYLLAVRYFHDRDCVLTWANTQEITKTSKIFPDLPPLSSLGCLQANHERIYNTSAPSWLSCYQPDILVDSASVPLHNAHKIDNPTASTSMTVSLSLSLSSFDCTTTRRGASSIKRMFKSAWSGKMTLDTSWRFIQWLEVDQSFKKAEMKYYATNGEIKIVHANLGQYILLPTRCIPNVCTTNG